MKTYGLCKRCNFEKYCESNLKEESTIKRCHTMKLNVDEVLSAVADKLIEKGVLK